MAGIVPPINATGIYTLATPFREKLLPNVQYTCLAVRKMADISALGVDVFDTYYEPYGLTEQVYQTDLAAGVTIVTLQAVTGSFLYVPDSFIQGYPDAGGVAYTGVVLGIDLGAIPDYLDLSGVKQAVSDAVQTTIGVVSGIKEVAVTPTVLLAKANSDALEAARLVNIASSETVNAQLIEVTRQRDEALQKLNELQTWMAANVTNP